MRSVYETLFDAPNTLIESKLIDDVDFVLNIWSVLRLICKPEKRGGRSAKRGHVKRAEKQPGV
jgi:hypothetical protein